MLSYVILCVSQGNFVVGILLQTNNMYNAELCGTGR